MLATADLTATATLILVGITLGLMSATVGLVIATAKLVTSTKKAATQAQEDAQRELRLLERQLGSTYRPLLVDVLAAGPILPDMGANDPTMIDERGMTISLGPPLITTKLPGMAPQKIDPRSVLVALENGKVGLTVPLRNVGRGLAVIDGSGVDLEGAAIGSMEYRTIQRYHVPVGETTRIDLIMGYRIQEKITAPGEVWTLTVPYSDFGGGQRATVRLQLVCRGDDATGPWLIERVEQASVA